MFGAVIGHGVRIFGELDRLFDLVGRGVQNAGSSAVAAVNHIDLVLPEQQQHAVRGVKAGNAAQVLAGPQVEQLERVVLFRCQEQPVTLQIDSKVIEVAVDAGQLHCLQQVQSRLARVRIRDCRGAGKPHRRRDRQRCKKRSHRMNLRCHVEHYKDVWDAFRNPPPPRRLTAAGAEGSLSCARSSTELPLSTRRMRSRSSSPSRFDMATAATALPLMLTTARAALMNRSMPRIKRLPANGIAGTTDRVPTRAMKPAPVMPLAPFEVSIETPRIASCCRTVR